MNKFVLLLNALAMTALVGDSGGGLANKIAFVSDREGNFEIYVMDADGENQINLTNSPSGLDFLPVWSPDGQRIVFFSTRDGDSEVYVMDADGTNQINLTNHPREDYAPSWSPDGKKIAFTSTRDKNGEIYVIDFMRNNFLVHHLRRRLRWRTRQLCKPQASSMVKSENCSLVLRSVSLTIRERFVPQMACSTRTRIRETRRLLRFSAGFSSP